MANGEAGGSIRVTVRVKANRYSKSQKEFRRKRENIAGGSELQENGGESSTNARPYITIRIGGRDQCVANQATVRDCGG